VVRDDRFRLRGRHAVVAEMRRVTLPAFAAAILLPLVMAPASAEAQWVRVDEQFYLQAPHNWVFRKNYPGVDRLFNAFDYGHAILYERLHRSPGDVAGLEEREYEYLTRRVLVAPPRLPVAEAAVASSYARLAPEAMAMFHWAHVLHRQIYDVLADERLTQAQKDVEVTRLVEYYKTRPDLAFSSKPKSMELMEGQSYSLAFRQRFPKFNGLIWAYHWLQIGLYEPLLTGTTTEERQTGVATAVARFRQMLESPPGSFPTVMPMGPAIAPEFSRRYEEAAIIFDNLHGLHDVISDVLANQALPRDRKRAEIMRAAARYRDDVSYVTTVAEWRQMALDMGLANQGGPVPKLPAPAPAEGGAHRHH
jgi:hypothetical protein